MYKKKVCVLVRNQFYYEIILILNINNNIKFMIDKIIDYLTLVFMIWIYYFIYLFLVIFFITFKFDFNKTIDWFNHIIDSGIYLFFILFILILSINDDPNKISLLLIFSGNLLAIFLTGFFFYYKFIKNK